MKIERSAAEKRKLDRFGRCENARISYVASGVRGDEVDQALAAVFAAAPDLWEGVPKNSVELVRSPGGGILEAVVDYQYPDRSASSHRRDIKSNGDREWLVEISTKMAHCKYAHSHIFSRKLDENAPDIDPGLLVDWNGKTGSASVSGTIPILESLAEITCIATFRRDKVDNRAYLRNAVNLVGKVNSEAFHNWHAGEVLFGGLKKSVLFEGKHGEDLCNLYFRFFIRTGGKRQIAGMDIGHVDGWDHLWLLRSHGAGRERIHSVHVSRLYPRSSFAVLDI
ncbi:MAG: hypothetical protein E7058_01615 [Lentisphaerae bacterium]|nr:hypothetical protein [Lentisphaerota bacterium]